ncbi:hypothetical protein F4778DRAFT_776684 [Xylariomycetidae sp. FL2044]|nr:hypothetical protein F4778DRAFT_776684 [Xylariomycetidae sp. FL2044]
MERKRKRPSSGQASTSKASTSKTYTSKPYPSKTKPLTEFTCFPRLPPEIRHMIWLCNITDPAPRLFQVESLSWHAQPPRDWNPCAADPACKPLPAPALLHTCAESRALVLGGLQASRATHDDDDDARDKSHPQAQPAGPRPIPLRALGFGPGLEHRRTWFDPAGDVLCVNAWHYGVGTDHFGRDVRRLYDLSGFSPHVRRICFSLASIRHGGSDEPEQELLPEVLELVARDLVDAAVCPQLQEFMLYDPLVALHVRHPNGNANGKGKGKNRSSSSRSGGVVVPRDLFPYGTAGVLVDARDKVKIARMRDFYRGNCMVRAGDETAYDDVWDLIDGGQRAYDKYAERMLTPLRNLWTMYHPHSAEIFRGRGPNGPAGGAGELVSSPTGPVQFDFAHPAVARVLARMPEYRLMVLFRLCRCEVHGG